jgi:hypothetical protein
VVREEVEGEVVSVCVGGEEGDRWRECVVVCHSFEFVVLFAKE